MNYENARERHIPKFLSIFKSHRRKGVYSSSYQLGQEKVLLLQLLRLV